MSYKTYITDALVCGSRVQNTADKTYLLFTREAGMLYATAKSVREERSKQRFGLQEFSYVRVSLVYGKTGWRITGAEPIVNVYALQSTREGRGLARNTVRLLRRLLQGESPHPELFDDLREMFESVRGTNPAELEEAMVVRSLAMLGYIAPSPSVLPIIEAPSIKAASEKVKMEGGGERKRLIEQAFRESHL